MQPYLSLPFYPQPDQVCAPLARAEMAGRVKKIQGATTVCVLTALQENTVKWVSIKGNYYSSAKSFKRIVHKYTSVL